MPPESSSNLKGFYQTFSEENVLQSRGYQLKKKLGSGSFAIVYLSEYTPLEGGKKPVTLACKVIDTSTASSDFVSKFLPRELDIIVKLKHPHIVHIHSIFQRGVKYYIFMRFAEEGDLLGFLAKYGAIVEEQAKIWFKQIISAITYLHDMNIAHRDLKCENVLLSKNYNVKLTDFGFARFCVNHSGKFVLSETYCGSLQYAPPEVIRGVPYNPKLSDMWSLGVVLFAMLSKSMPFKSTTVTTLIFSQENKLWKKHEMAKTAFSDSVKETLNSLLEPQLILRWNVKELAQAEWISGISSSHTALPGDSLHKQQSKLLSSMLVYIKKKGSEKFKWNKLDPDKSFQLESAKDVTA